VSTETGQSIGEALIGNGLVLAWTRSGKHRDDPVELEGDAKAHNGGRLN